MFNFNELEEKGYNIKQINQILLATDETKEILLKLKPDIPDFVFRKINKYKIKDLHIVLILNQMNNKNLSTLKETDDFFLLFNNKTNIIYSGIAPILKEAGATIVGMHGTGKSFSEIYRKKFK